MNFPYLDATLEDMKRCIAIVTEAELTVSDDTPRPRRGVAGSDAAAARAVGAAGLQVL